MFKMDEALKMKNNKWIETRLICPCCHMGFIKMEDEMDNKFIFPSDRRRFIVPIDYPTCNKCNTKFEVSIDKTLKISMREIDY